MKTKTLVIALLAMIVTLPIYSQEDNVPKDKVDNVEIVINTDKDAKDRVIAAFADMVELTKEEIQAGGRFAKEQIPIVLMEVVALERVEVTVTFSLWAILAVLAFVTGGKLKAYSIAEDKKEKSTWGDSDIGIMFMTSLVMKYIWPVATIVIMIANLRYLLTPWVAPRVFIMEYVAELIKSV